MPKDYFEVVVEEEEVLSEGEKHAKVIEFVYQVDMTKSDPKELTKYCDLILSLFTE